MRTAFILALGLLPLAMPASAAIVRGTDVDISQTPLTFGLGGNDFTFSYQPSGSFDYNPVFLTTTGTAAATAFGGFLGIPLQPSTFFTRANVSIGPDTFPGFASFTTPTAVPYSIVEGDLGLRVTVGGQDFYGFARFGGSTVTSYAFETTPDTPITAGSLAAVPEPATWGMMALGFGLAGLAMRRRRVAPARLVN